MKRKMKKKARARASSLRLDFDSPFSKSAISSLADCVKSVLVPTASEPMVSRRREMKTR